MKCDINRRGRDFIDRILRYHSKKFNRLQREDFRLVMIEYVIKAALYNFETFGEAYYVIEEEDTLDGVQITIVIPRSYVLGC